MLASTLLLATATLLSGSFSSLDKARIAARKPTAFAELRERVGKHLNEKPVSVMDKPGVGASKNKHDYFSYAPLWWPDPANPKGPWIWRDGVMNQGQMDKGDFRRFATMCHRVYDLAIAGYVLNDNRYSDAAAAQIRVWFLDPATRMNPSLNHAQAVPNREVGRAYGLVEMRFLQEVLDAATILQAQANGSWNAKDAAALKQWMKDYRTWLTTSPFLPAIRRLTNHHASWLDYQRICLALYLGDTTDARNILQTETIPRLSKQILEDGSQPEDLKRADSLSYSLFNLEACLRLAQAARLLRIDLPREVPVLRGGLLYVMPALLGERYWSLPQANPHKCEFSIAVLRLAALFYKDMRRVPACTNPSRNGTLLQILYL
jgi:hypothetical protein